MHILNLSLDLCALADAQIYIKHANLKIHIRPIISAEETTHLRPWQQQRDSLGQFCMELRIFRIAFQVFIGLAGSMHVLN